MTITATTSHSLQKVVLKQNLDFAEVIFKLLRGQGQMEGVRTPVVSSGDRSPFSGRHGAPRRALLLRLLGFSLPTVHWAKV